MSSRSAQEPEDIQGMWHHFKELSQLGEPEKKKLEAFHQITASLSGPTLQGAYLSQRQKHGCFYDYNAFVDEVVKTGQLP